MTEEQRPARERAYQPWSEQEYGVLERRYKSKDWSLGRIALSLSRYPSEIELALERLRSYNEELADKEETIRNSPERLIAEYGSGLRPLDAVLKPKTSILIKG